jgi:Mono-functional DNA-alkylating methyl methanesulfonate N-term
MLLAATRLASLAAGRERSAFPLCHNATHLLLYRCCCISSRCLCVRSGPRSALAVLRPGLAVSELAVSPLPGAPTAVFTLRSSPDESTDSLIVVSFSNATLVFEVGEEVKESSTSGFLPTVATLHTQLLEDGSLLQARDEQQCVIAVLGSPSMPERGWGGQEESHLSERSVIPSNLRNVPANDRAPGALSLIQFSAQHLCQSAGAQAVRSPSACSSSTGALCWSASHPA